MIDCRACCHCLIHAREGGSPGVICTSLADGGGGGAGIREGMGGVRFRWGQTRGPTFLREGFGGVRGMGGRRGEQAGQEGEK